MSNDEEMILRGRLTADYALAKQREALLDAERRRVGEILLRVANRFRRGDVGSYDDEDLEVLKSDSLLGLLSESSQHSQKFERLREHMKTLGIL